MIKNEMSLKRSFEVVAECVELDDTVYVEDAVAIEGVIGSQETYVMNSFDKKFTQDLKERKLYLTYEIDESVVSEIVYYIMQFNKEDKGIPVEERKPILLYMSTPGGSVADGFSLIDTIIASKTPVYSINIGYNYSMGFLINMVCHKRFAFPNSTYLMHDGTSFNYATTNKLFDAMEFQKKQEKRVEELVLRKTKITKDVYDKNRRIEWYLFADEAKEYGVCDLIVGVDVDLDEIV